MGFSQDLFPSEVDECFVCWMCKQVLENPLALPCGHVFCSSCASRWLLKFDSCPRECQGEVTIMDLNQVKPLIGLIDKLQCKCRNHVKGCGFVGALQDAKSHLELCEYQASSSSRPSYGRRNRSTDDESEIERLRSKADRLEEEVFLLQEQLSSRPPLIVGDTTRKLPEDEEDFGGALVGAGYDIKEVNGEDLSGASHEAAAEAFKRAAEPITVVLRRNNSNNNAINNNINNNNNSVQGGTGKTPKGSPASLERSESLDGMCFCQFLIEKCQKMPDRISSLIMNELMRYKTALSNQALDNDSQHNCDSTSSAPGDNCYLGEDFDDVFGYHYEEVTLKRASSRDRLGIMLSDFVDRQSGATRVLVNEVAIDSIAAKSRNIFEGDQIVKVNGVSVSCTNEASELLLKENAVVNFLICRQHLMDDAQWQDERCCELDAIDESKEDQLLRHHDNQQQQHQKQRGVFHDLTNRADAGSTTSEESRPRFLEQRSQDASIEYAAIVSQKLSCDVMGTTDSSHTAGSRTEKDSGIGQNTDSTVQSNVSRMFGTGSSGASSSQSAAQEFTFVPVQKYQQNKRTSHHKLSSGSGVAGDSADSAKGSMERSIPEQRNNGLQRLNEAIESLEINNGSEPKSTSSSSSCIRADPFADDAGDNVSPWVKIARQDYQDKIKQLENVADARVIHPALTPDDDDNLVTSSRSDSVATDNTSSAYSTGDSFRSSSSASGQHQSPPLSPEKHRYDAFYGASGNQPVGGGVSMSYYVSSDANSDGEGPACYLTHDDESGSEGFADAGLEFSPVFSPNLNPHHQHPHERLQHTRSAPTPAVRHSLCPNGFMNNSVTASTRQLWNDAAQAAQTRRHTASSSGENPSDAATNSTSRKQSAKHAPNDETAKAPQKPNRARRSSEQTSKKPPVARPAVTNRSFSYTEGQQQQAENNGCGKAASDASLEWKVRIRNDGTRYITKRPVREQILRHRERRLLAERCGVTTDDDAATELKLGRHWSRDERKRHMRIAREKKRRKDFMQRCRLEALNENAPADGEIVELSHKKMERRKHKRMLLDNFVTVQEILAHGDRSSGVTGLNPLLSVTYI